METKSILSTLERQLQLIQLIQQRQRVTVAEISTHFAISPATARRDLETLAERGQVQRFHGGAIAVHRAPPELPARQRGIEQAEEKRRIGQAAARLVNDGETVFLGSGTTILEVARYLRNKRNLTVITNSLLVINALTDLADMTVVSLGGVLRRSEMSVIGHITEQALNEVRADKVFMGIHALDADTGLTNDHMAETMTDRAILNVGRHVIIVADHTKCGRISAAFVAPITRIHTLITDTKAPPGFIEALVAKGIEVITA